MQSTGTSEEPEEPNESRTSPTADRAGKAKAVAGAVLLALALAPLHATGQSYGGYANPYPAQQATPNYSSQTYGQQAAPQPYGTTQQYGTPQAQQPYQQQPYQQQQQYGTPQPYPDQQQYANQPAYGAPEYPSEQDMAAPRQPPVQALNAGELEQLVAPIALYPDALLAQILAASTYPAQVSGADQWLQQMRAEGYGDPNQIAAGAMAQTSWDPSIKALTAFPDVLDTLNHNLQWTTALGNAYYNQPQDVMQTVQVLRQRAEQAGNLQSTPQEDVSSNQGYIDIAPPNPEVVYVPTYNPWAVYGAPISPYPGFSFFGALGSFFNGLPIQYGLGFAVGAFEHMPFGLLAWGLDWLAHSLLFDHGAWFSHSATVADWGLPHGGARAYPGGWRDPARYGYGAGRGAGYRGTQAWNQRGNYGAASARAGNYIRPALGVPYRPQNNAPQNNALQSRAANNYANPNNRGAQDLNRGQQAYANGYARAENPAYTHPASPAQQAYNRATPQTAYSYRPQTYPNRPESYAARPSTQAFSSPAYNYGTANRGGPSTAARPNSYAGSSSSYRAPQYDNRAYASHSYTSSGNTARNESARNDSGGFRGFSEKEPKYSAPKYSEKAPKSFGHEKAPKASKMSHSSGGGGSHHRL